VDYHSNQYNSLCLADDLMEPFRPWIDKTVYILSKNNNELIIANETKAALLGILTKAVTYQGKQIPFMVSCHYLAADLKRAFTDKQFRLEYPELVAL